MPRGVVARPEQGARRPCGEGTTVVNGRPSLEAPELRELWLAVRSRLERTGPDNRGRLRLPPLTSRGRLLLAALVGSPLSPGSPAATTATTVDLGALERSLAALGVGATLPDALSALGYPVSAEAARRRAARRAGQEAREAVRAEVATWPEPWAVRWIDEVIRAGVLAGSETPDALDLVRTTRTVLDRIDTEGRRTGGIARVDLAAEVLGSSHALDRGTKAEAMVTRALRHRFPGSDARDAWDRAGIQMDLVSAPALSWGLRAAPSSPMARFLDEAVRLGIPVHLSQLALRAQPIAVATGTDVLVVENPRIVEAAAQRRTPFPVVALNGNPSGAALLLVDQLLSSGGALRYHGDFDAAGLRICARMHDLGLVPFEMDRAAYLAAVDDARSRGAPLPADPHPAPPTPWDPALQAAFDACRRIVHEERLLATLLHQPEPEP